MSTTLWLFNIAMENGPFIDGAPIKTLIYKGISMAMLNHQMVNSTIITVHGYTPLLKSVVHYSTIVLNAHHNDDIWWYVSFV